MRLDSLCGRNMDATGRTKFIGMLRTGPTAYRRFCYLSEIVLRSSLIPANGSTKVKIGKSIPIAIIDIFSRTPNSNFYCRFAVNFMTSVADLYFKEIGCDIATPPDSLIELFTEWISENPNLCSETQPPLDLPPGAIPMALISPIEGLIRWCTLSAIFLPLNELLYSKLHLAVLQSLTQVS